LRAQYSKFSANVDNLNTTAKRINERVDAMTAKSQEYMARWDEDLAKIQNEDIRKRSAERKAAVTADLKDLKAKFADASDAFKPVKSDLRDVQPYLGADLTPAGTAAVKDTANKAINESGKLKEKVSALVAKFQEIGLKFPQPPPPPPPATPP